MTKIPAGTDPFSASKRCLRDFGETFNELTALVITSLKEATRTRSEPEGTEMKDFPQQGEKAPLPAEQSALLAPGPQWGEKARLLVQLGKNTAIQALDVYLTLATDVISAPFRRL